MRTVRYREIGDALRARLDSGELGPGAILPSEAALSAEFGASRVTIRKALDALRDEGHLASRQGFGWFVAADPLRQTLGRLGTIEGQLVESGRSSERRVIGFELVAPPPRARRVLGRGRVLEVRRLNLADGRPFARVTVWCPEELARHLTLAEVESTPFYELIDRRLGGATQTIGAADVGAADAALLDIPEGSAVLVCERVTRDVDGRPVLVSEHVFPAHLTEFSVELPVADSSIAPSGLRLVE